MQFKINFRYNRNYQKLFKSISINKNYEQNLLFKSDIAIKINRLFNILKSIKK